MKRPDKVAFCARSATLSRIASSKPQSISLEKEVSVEEGGGGRRRVLLSQMKQVAHARQESKSAEVQAGHINKQIAASSRG